MFQFRVSEIFNHLIDFNKRYIWALTIGCAITNMASPLGPIDILVGTSGTLISGLLIYAINKHVPNLKAKLAVSTIIPTVVGMIPIALELLAAFNIKVLVLPGHITHILQLFDVSLAAPFKRKYTDLFRYFK